MKKFFFFAIAALGMTVACQKGDVDTTPVDDNSPVAVTFGINTPTVEVTKTKAFGGVDAWETAKHQLYIYGFDRNVNDFTTTPFIENVAVAAPAIPEGNTQDPFLSGDVTPKHEVNGVTESFYYAANNTTYDFYGYYVDDAANAAQDVVKATDRVYVPVTITGGQDIMLAKAVQATDVEGTGVQPERAYSAYSARRGVKPVLKFQHQLARFRFFVVAGSSKTVEAGKKVSVTAVAIENAKVNADLNVVGENRGLVANDATATLGTLNLMEKDDNGTLVALNPVAPTDYYADAAERAANKTKIGESIMVIPGEASYKMVFTLAQEGVNTQIATNPIELAIDKFGAEAIADGAFMAGKQYDVTITVYGLEEVVITAELTPWTTGGDYAYDPDEDWGAPVQPEVTEVANEVATVVTADSQEDFEAFYTGFDFAAAQETLPWVGVKLATPVSGKIQVQVLVDGAAIPVTLKNVGTSWPADAVGGTTVSMTVESPASIISFEAKDELGWDGVSALPEYTIVVSTVE